MKRHVLRVLVLLNVVLLGLLLFAWLTPEGGVRGAQWSPPQPRLTDFASQLPALPSPVPADTAQFVAMLEKPLFSATRRPPPPPPPPAPTQEVPADNFSTAKLTGIFNSGGSSGIIIRMAGKDSRVQVNQTLDGWTLKSISGREATFASGGQTRVLQLLRADMTKASAPPSAATANASQRYPFLPAAPVNAASPASAIGASPPGDATPATTPAGAAPPPPPRAVFGGSRRR